MILCVCVCVYLVCFKLTTFPFFWLLFVLRSPIKLSKITNLFSSFDLMCRQCHLMEWRCRAYFINEYIQYFFFFFFKEKKMKIEDAWEFLLFLFFLSLFLQAKTITKNDQKKNCHQPFYSMKPYWWTDVNSASSQQTPTTKESFEFRMRIDAFYWFLILFMLKLFLYLFFKCTSYHTAHTYTIQYLIIIFL